MCCEIFNVRIYEIYFQNSEIKCLNKLGIFVGILRFNVRILIFKDRSLRFKVRIAGFTNGFQLMNFEKLMINVSIPGLPVRILGSNISF